MPLISSYFPKSAKFTKGQKNAAKIDTPCNDNDYKNNDFKIVGNASTNITPREAYELQKGKKNLWKSWIQSSFDKSNEYMPTHW